MTMHLVPSRWQKKPKHSADVRIAELQKAHAVELAELTEKYEQQLSGLRVENVALLNRQAAADDFFELLMHDVVTTNAGLHRVEELRQDAEVEAAQMQSERDDWRDEALALRAKFGPQLAAEANAHRIDVPPMERDTSAIEDQATGPIPVITLQQAFGTTDPAHVPAWASRD
ncbi:hypothetical protein [Streptomyces sp. NPDC050704]|uniref:hypothetical protein n=1 Tax=Streptomyces sp. NPDC050704 TaxID=3157219 RepID=UPI003429A24C